MWIYPGIRTETGQIIIKIVIDGNCQTVGIREGGGEGGKGVDSAGFIDCTIKYEYKIIQQR